MGFLVDYYPEQSHVTRASLFYDDYTPETDVNVKQNRWIANSFFAIAVSNHTTQNLLQFRTTSTSALNIVCLPAAACTAEGYHLSWLGLTMVAAAAQALCHSVYMTGSEEVKKETLKAMTVMGVLNMVIM